MDEKTLDEIIDAKINEALRNNRIYTHQMSRNSQTDVSESRGETSTGTQPINITDEQNELINRIVFEKISEALERRENSQPTHESGSSGALRIPVNSAQNARNTESNNNDDIEDDNDDDDRDASNVNISDIRRNDMLLRIASLRLSLEGFPQGELNQQSDEDLELSLALAISKADAEEENNPQIVESLPQTTHQRVESSPQRNLSRAEQTLTFANNENIDSDIEIVPNTIPSTRIRSRFLAPQHLHQRDAQINPHIHVADHNDAPIPLQRSQMGTQTDNDVPESANAREIHNLLQQLTSQGSQSSVEIPRPDIMNNAEPIQRDNEFFDFDSEEFEIAMALSGFENTNAIDNEYLELALAISEADSRENSVAQESTTESIETNFVNENQFDCSICMETYSNDNSASFSCSHIYCRNCICEYLTEKIGEGIIESIVCPDPQCAVEATEDLIKQLVSPPILERLEQLQLRKAFGTMEDIFYCPKPECGCPVTCEIDVGIGQCQCGMVFCTSCLKEYHGNFDCGLSVEEMRNLLLQHQNREREEEARVARAREEERRRRQQQDAESENFIKKECKKCPHCNSDIEKNHGCNYMTCAKCNGNFCWLCLKKISGYQHFNGGQC